jgi:chorismate--pyruvate lyase
LRAAHILESALSSTGGTVTAVLEALTGEVLEADRIAQAASFATISNDLKLAGGHPVIRRTAILRGRSSGRGYLYAETLLVPDRLPPGVSQRLESTTDPIGRVLHARGFVMRRTVLGTPDRTPSVARLGPENSVDAAIYARRYLVESYGVPVMLIDEWFLPDLRDAVLRTG